MDAALPGNLFSIPFALLFVMALLVLGAVCRAAELPPGSTKSALRLDAADPFFNDSAASRLHIQVDPEQLKALDDSPRTPIHAQILEIRPGKPDHLYRDVALHLKGGAGSFRRIKEKPAFTVSFDKFSPSQDFHGLDKIHLNNAVQDPSFMCEYLGAHVFQDAGIPAPRVTSAHVWLNELDLGIYVLKEGFDRLFFKKYFRDHSGDLYEGNAADIDHELTFHLGRHLLADSANAHSRALQETELAGQKQRAQASLARLVEAARDTDPMRRESRLEKLLDVDRFRTFLVCECLLNHWDGYGANHNNYRIYNDSASGKLVFLPHGMDQLLQNPGYPLLFCDNGLVARTMTESPQGRRLHFDRVARIRESTFTPDAVLGHLDRIAAIILPLAEEIGPEAVRVHKQQTSTLKKQIQERIANIDGQLARERKAR